MKQTGEKLREAREEKGLSIHEISLSLKINSKVLKAIEEGDTTNLPAKTFLRGFVQSYANYLNMDTARVLGLFHEEMGSTRPKPILSAEAAAAAEEVGAAVPEQSTSSPSAHSANKNETAAAIEKVNSKNQFKALAISGIMLLLAFLIYAVNTQVEKYTKEAQVVSAPNDEDKDDLSEVSPEEASPAKEASKHLPEAVEISMTSSNSATPQASASKAPATAVQIAANKPAPPAPAPTTTASAAPTTVTNKPATTTPPQQPAPAPAPAPTTTANKPTTTTPPQPTKPSEPNPAATALATSKPTTAIAASSSPLELIVEALEPVEIQYATSLNGSLNKVQLKAEQVHTFKSKSGISLNFSNGGAVNLILNGKDLGVPGKSGQPIQLKY